MPEAAPARRVETSRDGRRRLGILPKEKSPNRIVGDIRIVEEIEKVARNEVRCLGEVREAVDGLRKLGRATRAMPQLPCDKLWVRCARAHDARQRRRQRTRARPCGIGCIKNNQIGCMPQRGGGRGKAADECNIFRSFQQVAGRIFGEMHEQVGGGESRLERAGSGCRCAL